MALTRGGNVPLTGSVPTLSTAVVGVAWDSAGDRSFEERLSLAAILCDKSGKAVAPDAMVFFNQPLSADTSTAHSDIPFGDDDEQVEIDLDDVPAEVQRLVFVLYVADSVGARQPLSRLRSCVVRVVNATDGAQIVSSEDLAPGLGDQTAVMLGEVYRHGEGWKFKVIGEGYSRGLSGVLDQFGVKA